MRTVQRTFFTLPIWVAFSLFSCAHSGRVSTGWKDAFPSREAPADYQSPTEALRLFFETIDKDQLLLKLKQNRLKPAEKKFLSAAAFLWQEQSDLEAQLKQRKEIEILPGLSYSFDLEAFCVNPGRERPIPDDGFRLGPLKGGSTQWLPLILESYADRKIPRERIQMLIWALLSDARFDELTEDQQVDLLKLDPNAAIRFGNRRFENSAKDLLDDFLPDGVKDLQSRFESYRLILRDASKSYEEISELLAPIPVRDRASNQDWAKTDAGYLARVISLTGYSSIRFEIYMPPGEDPLLRPSMYIGLPSSGQRLAISANVVPSMRTQYRKITDGLVNFLSGRDLSKTEQELIRKRPLDAYKVLSNARTATKSAIEHFPRFQIQHNNPADAFRHFVWAALNTKDIGAFRAREFLDAHEDRPGQPKNEAEIDRWNNEKGIETAEKLGSNATLAEFEKAAHDALRNQELRIW